MVACSRMGATGIHGKSSAQIRKDCFIKFNLINLISKVNMIDGSRIIFSF